MFSYNKVSSDDLKEYIVLQGNYNKEGVSLIQVQKGQKDKEDRFYVIALENIGGSSELTWYTDKDNDSYDIFRPDYELAYDSLDGDFGKGKNNTITMIGLRAEELHGPSDNDICGIIRDTSSKFSYKNGWFVPAISELGACASNLNVEPEGNIGPFDDSETLYFSSSVSGEGAYAFYPGRTVALNVTTSAALRPVTTF